uniref:Chromatin target of PRMT1 protein C-terminal domain-containing protein n=1 Tax=Alexandrium catenella TaxID=2925 RepID=A0A7S1QM38_ALECA|mmetsp:Transcript_35015/g.94902  ORF Transcript_35015/g.94902 Transcript_35015/m.94902 type:complete len:225 (+) Transcript_35015:86-760(+)|eukprot:CAMPEP_0171188104 /NCGR_PEP_ID=MMETSP0790-20130122/17659_1 /TAXON_ID=2925 /ORGANISM="Alexandrium catenella, Strain OF101" /LENGTH=224 /DNA_ID=CAMNT_0011653175 /DNA_START=86 /DNA_END=760 /DNA_ORIENTATION=-
MRAWGDGPDQSSLPVQRDDEADERAGGRRSRSREWSRGRSPKGTTSSDNNAGGGWGSRKRGASSSWGGGSDWGGYGKGWGSGKGSGKQQGGGKGARRRRKGGGKGEGREVEKSAAELDGELNRYFGTEVPDAPKPMGAEPAKPAEADKAAPAEKDEAAVSAEEQKMRDRARRFGMGGSGPDAKAAAKATDQKPEGEAETAAAAGKEAPADGKPAGAPAAEDKKE